MPWIIKHHGRQIGKDYNTQGQAVEGAVDRKLVHFFEGVVYYQEGVEIQYLQIEERKMEKKRYNFEFLVRERLTRNRIYVIQAHNETEARYLLDGFKQEPEQIECSNEDAIIDNYDIMEVAAVIELGDQDPIKYETESVEYRVIGILTNASGYEKPLLLSNRMDELELDDLDLLEVRMAVEIEFNLDLKEESIELQTVQDLVDFVKTKLGVFRPKTE